MKKIIVTGGAGFIGSHLAGELVNKACQVTVIDDLSTGKKENLESILTKDNVQFIQGSVTDLPLLQQLFHNASYVFHLAALPSIPRSIENPLASHNANATGTLNVLIAARDNKVEKVIYSSSSSVYGDTPTLPKKEDMMPNPQSPYAVAKLAGEYYCQSFQRVYTLNTVCLRYFNVYGPGQDPGSQYAAVIPRFIHNCLQEKPPIIYGDGKQTRDFTYVDDVVAANILAAENQAAGVFNIGTESSVSINELANLVLKLTGRNLKPVHQDSRPGDIRHSLAAISKAGSFGFKPAYSLEEGLGETIKKYNTPK
jgi:UDP-glucose 4-epimerase